MENAAVLSKGLAGIPGLLPLKTDKRITQRGYYFYIIRFDAQKFGIERTRFVEAMKAEGAALGTGYGMPVYKLPVFLKMHFGRKGCPLTCAHYKGRMKYADVSCPVAEDVSRNRHLTISNHVLLKRSNVQLILDAARKIYEHRNELA